MRVGVGVAAARVAVVDAMALPLPPLLLMLPLLLVLLYPPCRLHWCPAAVQVWPHAVLGWLWQRCRGCG